MKKTYFTLVCLGALLFTSCDGSTNREWHIINNSSTTIFIETSPEFWQNPIDPIPANTEKTIIVKQTIRGESFTGSPTDYANFLIFNTADTLIKNPNEDNNWNTTTKKTKNLPARYTHKFVFELNNSDF